MSRDADLSARAAEEKPLRHVFPEIALADLMDTEASGPDRSDTPDALGELLRASRGAYAGGRRTLRIPAVLTGGAVPFDAPAGTVRRELVSRLDQLVRTGRLQRRDANAVLARFGLDGQPGSAEAARAVTGLRRQATSDALNRAIEVVAADISAQPLMPLEAPRLTAARRQLIVGAVLSMMHGPPQSFGTRLYAHMRVRAELLGDPVFPVGPADSTERQRRRRLANRWLAITSDHLDRDKLPLDQPLAISVLDCTDLEAWRALEDEMATPSIGAMRALVAKGEAAAFEQAPSVKGMLGLLLDGYRPLVELLRVAQFARATSPSSEPWARLDRQEAEMLRATALLMVGDLLANRGYPDAAALYVGLGQDGTRSTSVAAWLRFRRLVVMEGISYLQGPTSIDKTREWQQTLVAHLDRYGGPHDALAAAHAMIRAEHAAWTAGVASGATVDELLQPLEELLEEGLRKAPAENRARFELVRSRLAKVIGGRVGQTAPGALQSTGTGDATASQDRFDEWYCAHPVAMARWDHRGNPRGSDEWRR